MSDEPRADSSGMAVHVPPQFRCSVCGLMKAVSVGSDGSIAMWCHVCDAHPTPCPVCANEEKVARKARRKKA